MQAPSLSQWLVLLTALLFIGGVELYRSEQHGATLSQLLSSLPLAAEQNQSSTSVSTQRPTERAAIVPTRKTVTTQSAYCSTLRGWFNTSLYSQSEQLAPCYPITAADVNKPVHHLAAAFPSPPVGEIVCIEPTYNRLLNHRPEPSGHVFTVEHYMSDDARTGHMRVVHHHCDCWSEVDLPAEPQDVELNKNLVRRFGPDSFELRLVGPEVHFVQLKHQPPAKDAQLDDEAHYNHNTCHYTANYSVTVGGSYSVHLHFIHHGYQEVLQHRFNVSVVPRSQMAPIFEANVTLQASKQPVQLSYVVAADDPLPIVPPLQLTQHVGATTGRWVHLEHLPHNNINPPLWSAFRPRPYIPSRHGLCGVGGSNINDYFFVSYDDTIGPGQVLGRFGNLLPYNLRGRYLFVGDSNMRHTWELLLEYMFNQPNFVAKKPKWADGEYHAIDCHRTVYKTGNDSSDSDYYTGDDLELCNLAFTGWEITLQNIEWEQYDLIFLNYGQWQALQYASYQYMYDSMVNTINSIPAQYRDRMVWIEGFSSAHAIRRTPRFAPGDGRMFTRLYLYAEIAAAVMAEYSIPVIGHSTLAHAPFIDCSLNGDNYHPATNVLEVVATEMLATIIRHSATRNA